jgi:hypothetical protein
MNNVQEYADKYTSLKEELLLPDDIELMRSIIADVALVPKTTTVEELIELESRLAVASFKLAGLVGRLSGQYDMMYREMKRDVSKRTTEIMNAGEKGGYARAGELADAEFTDRRIRLSTIEGIVDEYKGKGYALKDIFLAITHRIHHLNKN